MRLRIHPKSRSLAPEAPQSIMCKLSVIIPIYNTSAALPRCIDSILCQSFADFELLLVDDGSTDGSGALCDQYATKDSRIRVFHKPWGGTSSARNVGLDHATGEWVTFVDSDDYIEEGSFALRHGHRAVCAQMELCQRTKCRAHCTSTRASAAILGLPEKGDALLRLPDGMLLFLSTNHDREGWDPVR